MKLKLKQKLSTILQLSALVVALSLAAQPSFADIDDKLDTDWSMGVAKLTKVLPNDQQATLIVSKLHGSFTANAYALRYEKRFPTEMLRVNAEVFQIQDKMSAYGLKNLEEQRVRSTIGKGFIVGDLLIEPSLLVEYRNLDKFYIDVAGQEDHWRYRPILSIMNMKALADLKVYPFAQFLTIYSELENERTLDAAAMGFQWQVARGTSVEFAGYRAFLPPQDMYVTGASVTLSQYF